MKRLSLLVILVLLIGIVGCSNEDVIADYEETISDLEDQVEDLQASIETLEVEKEAWEENDEALAVIYAQLESDNEMLMADNDDLAGQIADLQAENEYLYAEIGELEASANMGQGPWNYELYMVSGNESRIWYDIVPKDHYLQVYNVVGDDVDIQAEYPEYGSATMGTSEFGEGVRVIVYGTVENFQWVDLVWDESYTEYETTERESLGTVTNTVVDIMTVLPEGLPGQAVQWTTEDGETHGFLISYDGIGHSGLIILP